MGNELYQNKHPIKKELTQTVCLHLQWTVPGYRQTLGVLNANYISLALCLPLSRNTPEPGTPFSVLGLLIWHRTSSILCFSCSCRPNPSYLVVLCETGWFSRSVNKRLLLFCHSSLRHYFKRWLSHGPRQKDLAGTHLSVYFHWPCFHGELIKPTCVQREKQSQDIYIYIYIKRLSFHSQGFRLWPEDRGGL